MGFSDNIDIETDDGCDTVSSENYNTHYWRQRNLFNTQKHKGIDKINGSQYVNSVYVMTRDRFTEPSDGYFKVSFNARKEFANEEKWRIRSILTMAYNERPTFRELIALSERKSIIVVYGFHDVKVKGKDITHFNIQIDLPSTHYLYRKTLHVNMKITREIGIHSITASIEI